MAEISVIMPVYNVETYLADAIESVKNQTYEDWELLLIENGSQDKSPEICETYAKEDRRIHWIRGEKQGSGFARNQGMDLAEGEYLMFLDADDFLPEKDTMLRLFRLTQHTHADITIGNYERLWEGNRLPARKNRCYALLPADSGKFRFRGFFSVGSLSYVWGRIYRTKFLKENKIRFADYEYAEDKAFNIECYLKGAHYAFLEAVCYIYRKNENSISYQYKPNSKECWIRMAAEIRKSLEEQGEYEKKKDLVQDLIFFAAFFDAKMEYQVRKRPLFAVRKVLKNYASDPLGKEIFHELAFEKKRNKAADLLWRCMIRGFSIGMSLHLYFLLTLGIKILIDLKVDERLSDTGKREEKPEVKDQ